MTPIRMAFPWMRKSKASSPRCSTSQRATIATWKPISTRSVVSNGPGRINQAFSVRSLTWPKSQLRDDWAIKDDRKSDVKGKRECDGVEQGGRRRIKKQK